MKTAAVLLAALMMVSLSVPRTAYAAKDSSSGEPVRAVHNVGVGSGAYCFFVTHNVVITAADVAGKTDDEITAYILDKAGLYMKKANCNKAANAKIITVEDWTRHSGSFYLSDPDLAAIRQANPADGSPVKLYMNLLISEEVRDTSDNRTDESEETTENTDTDEADNAEEADKTEEAKEAEEAKEEEEAGEAEEPKKEAPLYSTFRRTEPELLFVVVASENDAQIAAEVCKEEPQKEVRPSVPDGGGSEAEDDTLPEYRTITMVDRSGKPVADPLKDGEPVELEWVEPKNNSGTEETPSFADRIPGGIISIAAFVIALAALVIALAARARKKKRSDW